MNKFILIILNFLLFLPIALGAEKMVRCEYVGGMPCQCQYERKITINDDGPYHGQQRTVFVLKNCPPDIARRLSLAYWGTDTRPDNHRTSPKEPVVELPQNDFNSSPFAQPLAEAISSFFGRQQQGTLQNYLDRLRSWAPIDPQMAKDVENFKQEHSSTSGQMSQGDQETYESLKEMLKLSQDLRQESSLPPRERPTPLPPGLNHDKIRQQYANMYQSAQENRPQELNKVIDQVLRGMGWMSASERTFHRTELTRTFLNSDLTYKSLPYVPNPGIKLESNSDTVAGMASRTRINNLMAAQSEAMQSMHANYETSGREEVDRILERLNRNTRQMYKNIELLDRVRGYMVDSKEFEEEAEALVTDFTQDLGSVRTGKDANRLMNQHEDRIARVQEKRIGVKQEILDSWGGSSSLRESTVKGLKKTSSELMDQVRSVKDKSEAAYYRDLAEGALDLALGFIPVVSTAKDFYEMVSGESLLSGEKLSVSDRAILAVSVVVDVATVGVGGRVTKVVLGKGLDTLGKFIKDVPVTSLASKIIAKSEEVMIDMGAKKFTHVLKTPWGSRPDPSTYLSKSYIDNHLAKFDGGAIRLMPKSKFDTRGPSQVDGTAFILPKNDVEKILSQTGGDRRKLEKMLGLTEGHFGTEAIVRLDIPNPKSHNLKIPTGNEAGAKNALWIPGGKLPSGLSEGVVDISKNTPGIIEQIVDI